MNNIVALTSDMNYYTQDYNEQIATKTLLKTMSECFPSGSKFSNEKLEIYLKSLQFFPFKLVNLAFMTCINEKPFFPELSEMLDKIIEFQNMQNGIQIKSNMELFRLLYKFAYAFNYREMKEFQELTEIEKKLIREFYQTFRTSEEWQVPEIQKRFCKRYRELYAEQRKELDFKMALVQSDMSEDEFYGMGERSKRQRELAVDRQNADEFMSLINNKLMNRMG